MPADDPSVAFAADGTNIRLPVFSMGFVTATTAAPDRVEVAHENLPLWPFEMV